MRIVSLLPSATEIICEVGLREHLVGISHECDFPKSVTKLPAVTRSVIPNDVPSNEIDSLVRDHLKESDSLYELKENVLTSLEPDLIVTQSLCNVCAVSKTDVDRVVGQLPGNPQVVNLEPMRVEEVFESMQLIGRVAGIETQATKVIQRLRQRVEEVRSRSQRLSNRRSVVFLEWVDPPFCAGHWTPELIRFAGGVECLGEENARSRTVSWQQVIEADPDVIVIACCGFDLERVLEEMPKLQRQPGFDKLRCVRQDEVYAIDGNAYFNRPGPRLVDSLQILANTLHPSAHPLPSYLDSARKVIQ